MSMLLVAGAARAACASHSFARYAPGAARMLTTSITLQRSSSAMLRACSVMLVSPRFASTSMRHAAATVAPSTTTSAHKYTWAETEMAPPSPGRGYIGRSANFEVKDRDQQVERWSWLLKLLGFMNEDSQLFTSSNCVLQSCMNQTAHREFFQALQLTPNFRGQQALLLAHVWMVHRRLSMEGDSGKVMQELMFDRLWEETAVRIRFMNVSELTVNKHLAEVQQHCFNACIAYDRAFKSGTPADFQQALASHLLADDDSANAQRAASKMADYMKRELKNLDKVEAKYVLQGTIPWGPYPSQPSSSPPSDAGDEDYTVIGEKVGNWRAALDNRGKLYYWNLSTRLSVWERPTGDALTQGLEQQPSA